ncbi:MAG: hypothetical protein AAF215_19960 [Cyanobacteria bacterium P01_A01_bin.123]
MQKNSKRNPKPTASKPVQIIELSEKDLKPLAEPLLQRIAGGVNYDGGCPSWMCGTNHNETVVNTVKTSQLEKLQLNCQSPARDSTTPRSLE